jgi:hypothetical protein
MNNEVIKAMNKKEDSKIKQFKKWWSKNGYKVMRVILFPLWGVIVVSNKIDHYLDSRQKWSEERANEIFNYFVPRNADWDAEDKTFYLCFNSFGWNLSSARRYLKRKDRRFWCNHNGFWGGELRKYLIEEFELEGFTKELGDCEDGWTQIAFKLIEK